MSSSFKSWFKNIIATFLIFALKQNACSQEEKLQPEMDNSNGLRSNAVKCIKVVSKGNTWVGTDNGLNILGGLTDGQKKIIDIIGNKGIFGIELLDSLVFIGSRFDGLLIFDITSGVLIHHYQPQEINHIWKIKVFNREVFILTNDGPYRWSKNVLNKLQFLSDVKDAFIIDMFQWENSLYGIAYFPFHIMRFNNSSFSEKKDKEFFGKDVISFYNPFCATVYENKLFIASSGASRHLITVVEKNKAPVSYNILKGYGDGYIIWDMAVLKDKIILAIGDTYTNAEGLLYQTNLSFSNPTIKHTDYINCLGLDSFDNAVYYGTLRKGLYLQRGVSCSLSFDKPEESILCANEKNTFYYNSQQIQKADNSMLQLLNITHDKNGQFEPLKNIALSGDTLISANNKIIEIFNISSAKPFIKKLTIKNRTEQIAEIQILNNSVFLFENYGRVFKSNLETGEEEVVANIKSTLPYPQKFGEKIILLNREKEFNVITMKESYSLSCTDKNIAFASDFTVIHDTLIVLIKNQLQELKIDYVNHQLILLKIFPIDSICEGFLPQWLLSKDNKLYVLNSNGIMQWNLVKGNPEHYYYLGNYFKLQKPIIGGDSLLWASNSTLCKVPFTDINKSGSETGPKDINLVSPESVNEHLDFKLSVNCPEYLIQNHSLKTVELIHNGKVVQTKYTINNIFNFDNGLQYGNYNLSLKVGNAILNKEITITLPLNRNPYFFGSLLFLILVILFIGIKNWMDKKTFTKKLTQTRLQSLKQNLNPHFVYNSMNLISSLILEAKYDEAVQVVSDFSKLQRTYLETNNKEVISLAEELDFLESYLKLQQKRFDQDNEFTYNIYISPEVNPAKIMLPPLILQPIAENAVKYGVLASYANPKKISIEVSGINPVIISIEDNGKDVVTNLNSLGLGQKLIEERLNLYNAGNHSNTIKVIFGLSPSRLKSGYKVSIEVTHYKVPPLSKF